MRLVFRANNLSEAIFRGKGSSPRVGGKPTRWAPYAMRMMAEEDRSVLDNLRHIRAAKKARFEGILAEARRRQALLKTSLFVTILSES